MKPTITHETTAGNFLLEKALNDILSSLGPSFPGNVYYVVQSDVDYYADFWDTLYEKYDDNSVSIHNTIQAAVDASEDNRGDLILVTPDKWQENVIIQDKQGLKIRAIVPGWPTQVRASDGGTKYPFTPVGGQSVPGACFLILDRGVEVSGFCCDGGGGYAGIYVGDGYRVDTDNNENSASALVFNNLFRGEGAANYGVVLDGCSDNVKVLENFFNECGGDGIYICPGGNRTVQRPIIQGNRIIASGKYGIDMYSSATTVRVQIIGNFFADGASAATYGVRCQGAGVHNISKNSFACTNKISASATDLCSGNTTSSAGNSPTFVEEE